MKTLHLTLLYLLMLSPVFAQLQPEFETMFYFEDAVGNRDTIIVGYDREANLDYNPDFGEIDISETPFDSIFEVRAGRNFFWVNDDIVMTKKIIMWTEPIVNSPNNCISPAWPIFFINAKHLPITISWGKRIFLDAPCLTSSYITTFNSLGILDFWWNPYPDSYVCLAEDESWTIDLIPEDNLTYYSNDHQTIEGVEGDTTILGVALVIDEEFNFFSPCRYIVDVEDVQTISKQIGVFPNPTSDLLYFDSNTAGNDYRIFDVTGKLVQNGVADDAIPVSNLAHGVYFIKIGEGELSKFLKK